MMWVRVLMWASAAIYLGVSGHVKLRVEAVDGTGVVFDCGARWKRMLKVINEAFGGFAHRRVGIP